MKKKNKILLLVLIFVILPILCFLILIIIGSRYLSVDDNDIANKGTSIVNTICQKTREGENIEEFISHDTQNMNSILRRSENVFNSLEACNDISTNGGRGIGFKSPSVQKQDVFYKYNSEDIEKYLIVTFDYNIWSKNVTVDNIKYSGSNPN